MRSLTGKLAGPFMALVAIGLVFAVSSGAGTSAPATDAQVHAAVVAGASVKKVPSDVQPSLEAATHDAEQLADPACSMVGSFGECAYGPATAKHSAVLFGDSHAGMWFDGLEAATARAGWNLRIFYKSGCPAVMLTFYDDGAACNSFRNSAINAIRKLHPTMVIVTSASFEQQVHKQEYATEAQWKTGMEATLRRLEEPHTRLVVLGDIPLLAESDPECLAAHESDVEACSTPREEAVKGVYMDAESTAAAAAGARRIDVTDWLCADICPPIINGIVVYRNQFHITRTYSLYLAGVLEKALRLDG